MISASSSGGGPGERIDVVHAARAEQGEGDGEAFGALVGASEQEVFSAESDLPELSLDLAIADVEAAIGEAPPKRLLLVNGVERRGVQRRLGDEVRMQRVNPLVEGVDERQRLLPAACMATLRGKDLGLAGIFDAVE